RRGGWRLAPAYDLIYAYNPNGAWTHRHQMTLAGKRENFTLAELLDAGSAADLKPAKAKSIFKQVHHAVFEWQTHAEAAGVPADWMDEIRKNLRNELAVTR
ncbi:MAG TPA: HipA domain-containing protein, partial [Luteolibacter sp.]